MAPNEKESKPPMLLYGWYYEGEPKSILEKGKQSESQGMFPHYRIEVKKNLGPDIKMGVLSGYNAGSKEWFQLKESNIGGDNLYKAKKESLAKNHFLYLKGFGLWKVDGLSVDAVSAVIQITRFNV
jgi:hypothetical protein